MGVMSDSNTTSSDTAKNARQILIRYLCLTLALFVAVGAINFYQILMVAPDTVGMKQFKLALFSSAGFIRDLCWFLGAAIFVHLFFVLFLWLGTAGWLAAPDMRERQRKITTYFSFVVACAWIMILSTRHYPNMPSTPSPRRRVGPSG